MLLAAVLVDLAVLSAIGPIDERGPKWPHWLLAAFVSLAFSQVNLVAIWVGLSRWLLPWRLAAWVVVVTLWSSALATVAKRALPEHSAGDWTLLLLAQSSALLALLGYLRARGGRLVHADQTEPVKPQRRWQFSLGHLLAWITAAAISMGMLRWTVDYELLASGGENWPEIVTMSVLNSALGLAAFVGLLGSRPLIFRVLAICVTLGAVISVAPLLGAACESSLALAVLWLMDLLWLSAALGVIRVAGFRFERLRAAK